MYPRLTRVAAGLNLNLAESSVGSKESQINIKSSTKYHIGLLPVEPTILLASGIFADLPEILILTFETLLYEQYWSYTSIAMIPKFHMKNGPLMSASSSRGRLLNLAADINMAL